MRVEPDDADPPVPAGELAHRADVRAAAPAEDERSLDQWESLDLGHFHKVKLRVHLLEGDVLAWVYLLDAYEGGLPSARYLGVIADAAEAAGAPEDYVAELRSRPCTGIGPTPGGG